MAETVRTRHKISGQIDENTPRHIAEHEVLGEYLEIVGPDEKPFLPEMHKAEAKLHAGEIVIPKSDLPKVDLPSPKNSKD